MRKIAKFKHLYKRTKARKSLIWRNRYSRKSWQKNVRRRLTQRRSTKNPRKRRRRRRKSLRNRIIKRRKNKIQIFDLINKK